MAHFGSVLYLVSRWQAWRDGFRYIDGTLSAVQYCSVCRIEQDGVAEEAAALASRAMHEARWCGKCGLSQVSRLEPPKNVDLKLHTHTHTHAHARTHTHTHAHTRTRARTHSHTMKFFHVVVALSAFARHAHAGAAGFPPEPASCIAEVKKLCGQCGTDMACLKKCGYAHIPQLVKAGCRKPSTSSQLVVQEAATTTGNCPRRISAASCISKCKNAFVLSDHAACTAGCNIRCDRDNGWCTTESTCEMRCADEYDHDSKMNLAACKGACALRCPASSLRGGY